MSMHRQDAVPKVEKADGHSKRGRGGHQFLKRRKRRLERKQSKLNPEYQATYNKHRGWET